MRSSLLGVVGFEGLFEHDEGALEVVNLEHIGHAHLVLAQTGGGVETAGGGHHHGLTLVVELLEAPAAKVVDIGDGQLGHGIEGTHGHGTIDAGNLVESLHQAVAAGDVLVIDGLVVTHGSVERRLGNDLADEGRAQAGLGELHGGVAHFHVAGDEGADADAALAVALAHAVNHDDVVLDALEVHGAGVGLVAVDELAVHLVGKQEQVVLLDQVAQFGEFLVAVEGAGGVVGVADHDGLGVGGDGLLELLDGRQCEAALDVAGDGLDLSAAEFGEGVVVGVVRFGDDDFVVGVEADGEVIIELV